VGTWSALLDSADVQRGGPEVHLLPPQVHKLRSPQTVPVGHQHHCCVTVAPAVLPGRVHQPFDLGLGQVLAGPQLAVRSTLGGRCSVYGGWRA
jgi:hypothetical protein